MSEKARALEKIASFRQMSAPIREEARKELQQEIALDAIWKDVTRELLGVNA